MRTLIASLVLAGIALSLTPVATGETVHLVRIVEMDRTKSFSLMSGDEFREAQALINAERRLFPKAMQMTLASWTEDGIYPPFPRNSITLRSIAKIAPYNSMDVDQIKLAYRQEQEEKRRKAFEKRRNDRQ